MRATLDWSHELLSGPEKELFARLSVFAGGFALEAAETVGEDREPGEEDALVLLEGLVEQLLVLAEPGKGADCATGCWSRSGSTRGRGWAGAARSMRRGDGTPPTTSSCPNGPGRSCRDERRVSDSTG